MVQFCGGGDGGALLICLHVGGVQGKHQHRRSPQVL